MTRSRVRSALALLATVVVGVLAFSGTSPASGIVPVVAFQSYSTLDPASANFAQTWQVEYATCSQLLSYSDDPAPAGSHLVPDAATALPTVSADGLTYTFAIRSGLGFSDGSGDVNAASFERALQRVAALNTSGFAFMSGISGATAGSGTISGVNATGNTLTITLSAPDGAFPTKMATPYFCAVPSSTAASASTLTPIPSAGPYYVSSGSVTTSSGNITGFHLLRNPNYGGDRPAVLDEIAVTVEPNLSTSYAAATAGSPTVDFTSVAAADRSAADSGYGTASATAAAGHQQYFTPSSNGVQYVAFNTARITDFRVRQAIALVMNRTQLAADLGAKPTDDLVSSSVQGYEDWDLYAFSGDVLAAQALMQEAGYGPGAHLALKLITRSTPAAQVTFGNHLTSELQSIYIDVTFDHSQGAGAFFTTLGTPSANWDLAQISWLPDYADTDGVLSPLLDGRQITVSSVGTDYSHWNDAATNADLDYADGLSGAARDAALAHLAERLAADEVPLAAVGEFSRFEFVSARVGCVVYQPVYGLDLTRLCEANSLAADGTYSTPPPTADDPVSVEVKIPVAGDVSVVVATEPEELTGYNVLGQQLLIEAPDGTVADPLTITLTLDEGTLTDAVPVLTAATVPVLRNGSPIGPCDPIPPRILGHADPDPCVSTRTTDVDGNAVITILTSHASLWGFGNPDSTPPTIDSTDLDPASILEGHTTVISAATSGDATLAEFYADTDNGAGSNLPLGGSTGEFESPAYGQLLPAGEHTIGFRARDAAGNWSDVETDTLTVLDMTTIDSGPPSLTNSTSATFTFSSPANGATFECSLDGAAFAACSSPVGLPSLSRRTHRFLVKASDGIVDPTPASRTWTNGTPPKATFTSTPGPASQAAVTFGFTSSDPGAAFLCKLDDGAETDCTSPVALPVLAEGNHRFSVTALDGAGRHVKPASHKWRVDLDPPETTIAKGPTNPTAKTAAHFKLTSDEKNVTFECNLDAGTWTPCPKGGYTGLLSGGHTLLARAVDQAGNTDPTPDQYDWVIL